MGSDRSINQSLMGNARGQRAGTGVRSFVLRLLSRSFVRFVFILSFLSFFSSFLRNISTSCNEIWIKQRWIDLTGKFLEILHPLSFRISKVGKRRFLGTEGTDSSEKIVELSNIDTREGNWDIFTPFRRESWNFLILRYVYIYPISGKMNFCDLKIGSKKSSPENIHINFYLMEEEEEDLKF